MGVQELYPNGKIVCCTCMDGILEYVVAESFSRSGDPNYLIAIHSGWHVDRHIALKPFEIYRGSMWWPKEWDELVDRNEIARLFYINIEALGITNRLQSRISSKICDTIDRNYDLDNTESITFHSGDGIALEKVVQKPYDGKR